MSYTDLLQSYQDRLSSMVENEDSVSDYVLNKGQAKINEYLESAGIPAEIGGAFEQIGILANNSAVKSLVENSGLKGVFDEKVEALTRNFNGLKDQLTQSVKEVGDSLQKQAQDAAKNVLQKSQETIDTGRDLEASARETMSGIQNQVAEAQQTVVDAPLGTDEFFNQMMEQMKNTVTSPEQPENAEPISPREPTNYQVPEEPVAQPPEPQELTEFARDTTSVAKDVGEVGTTIEETTSELPGIGEVGEVVGALLQIGSLIASAFKPHESTPDIVTPVSGFGFGSMNQFGGSASIV